jgi:recombinational DNA repair protein RecT
MSTGLKKSEELIERITKKVNEMVENEGLKLPSDYNYKLAIRNSITKLTEIKDSNKLLCFDKLSNESIIKVMLKMVTKGLDYSLNHCYFVAKGDKLEYGTEQWQGNVILALRMDSRIKFIRSQVIYKDDVFEIGFRNGAKYIKKHEQDFFDIGNEIIGAYAVAVYDLDDETKNEALIKNFSQIELAWKQGYSYQPGKATAIANKFKEEMCEKTVKSSLCRKILSSSLVNIEESFDMIDDLDSELSNEIIENMGKQTIELAELSENKEVTNNEIPECFA